MDTQTDSLPSNQIKTPRRAKIACKSCNARRVKCDASESQPCWHCKIRQKPCELIESRRGRYPRKRKLGTNKADNAKSSPNSKLKSSTPSAIRDVSLVSGDNAEVFETNDQSASSPSDTSNDEPEMLYARMSELGATQESPPELQDKGRTLYLGEAYSLAFVVNTVCSPSGGDHEVKVHYPVPPSVMEHNDRNHQNAKFLVAEDKNVLEALGAFTLPKKDVSDDLLRVFFECFHPGFPVLDRRAFASLYQNGRAPFIVLQTIYFLAVSICDDELLARAGFTDRKKAKRAFYRRAKALYDADYEKDQVVVAAVVFLLCFWWEGPEDQKDTWHWLGAAISLAQKLGMHRSTARSGMSPRNRSLWKRIWWSIYLRDRHIAAALGRPMRIRDEDCDVEFLDEADFQIDVCQSSIIPAQQEYHISYAIEITKLAIILGKIIMARFSPSRRSLEVDFKALGGELITWESLLPREMRRCSLDQSFGAPFWACMLQACYTNCQILLFRPDSTSLQTPAEVENDAIARSAADAVTRIAEDLLAAGTIGYAQIHVVPALFAALGMHAIVIRRKDTIRGQLAENRARQCMLAMSELAKCWPVAGWILHLFISVMSRLTGQDFRSGLAPTWKSSHTSGASEKRGHTNHQQDKGSFAGPKTAAYPDQVEAERQIDHQTIELLPNRPTATVDNSQTAVYDSLWPYNQDLLDLDSLFQQSLEEFGLYDFGMTGQPTLNGF